MADKAKERGSLWTHGPWRTPEKAIRAERRAKWAECSAERRTLAKDKDRLVGEATDATRKRFAIDPSDEARFKRARTALRKAETAAAVSGSGVELEGEWQEWKRKENLVLDAIDFGQLAALVTSGSVHALKWECSRHALLRCRERENMGAWMDRLTELVLPSKAKPMKARVYSKRGPPTAKPTLQRLSAKHVKREQFAAMQRLWNRDPAEAGRRLTKRG